MSLPWEGKKERKNTGGRLGILKKKRKDNVVDKSPSITLWCFLENYSFSYWLTRLSHRVGWVTYTKYFEVVTQQKIKAIWPFFSWYWYSLKNARYCERPKNSAQNEQNKSIKVLISEPTRFFIIQSSFMHYFSYRIGLIFAFFHVKCTLTFQSFLSA